MVRYRQLEAPAQVETNIPSTGASQAANSLANAFRQFEGLSHNIAMDIQTQRGQQAGAEAGAKGTPEFKRGFGALTAFGKAYNNAAYREYAVVAEAQIEDAAAKAEQESNNDPVRFKAIMEAQRDKTLKEAQPEARALFSSTYNQHIARGTARLTKQQLAERKARDREVGAEGVQRSVDRIARGYASGDEAEYAAAEVEQEKLNIFLDAMQRDGTITPVEREVLHAKTQRDITKATVTEKFRQELDRPYGDPVKFIKNLKEQNKTSEALLPDEEEKLVDALLAEMQQHNAIEAAGISDSKNEQKARFATGERDATLALLSGTLTQRKIADMVAAQDLDPTVARTLNNELQQGAGVVDDPKKYFHVKANLLAYTPEEIATMPGLSFASRKELWNRRDEDARGWKGTQSAREAVSRIDRALGIPEGGGFMALDQAKADARDKALTKWYDAVDLLPPQEREKSALKVADEMISEHIRNSASMKAQKLRDMKNALLTSEGDPSKLSDARRNKLQEKAVWYDEQIRRAEQEAAK